MKRILALLLALSLLLCLAACGKTAKKDTPAESTVAPEEAGETAVSDTAEDAFADEADAQPAETEEVPEEEQIDDAAWDSLEALGDVETENGIFYVYITVPADFAGDDTTQESLDAQAGDTYTSAVLNEDGSITYKMTKKQHKAMMDEYTANIDAALEEIAESPDYAVDSIEHNSDFSSFDVYLSTDELGLAESFMVLPLYMYGGLFAVFAGQTTDNVVVNFYNAAGDLINTGNSADMEDVF